MHRPCPLLAAAIVVILAVISAGCGKSDTAPSAQTPSYSGTWNAPLSLPASGGSGVLQLRVTQDDDQLAGTWTLGLLSSSSQANGTIAGRAMGTTLTLVLTPTNNACQIKIDGTRATDTRIDGSVQTFSSQCPSGYSTTITLTRQ